MFVTGYVFPNDCPTDCDGAGDKINKTNICPKCPIFNCQEVEDTEGRPFRIIEPDDFPFDWARQFSWWFKSGNAKDKRPKF